MKNLPSNYLMVGISRSCPNWLKGENQPGNFLFVPDNVLAPPASLLSERKSGNVSDEEYKRRYKEHIHYSFSHSIDYKDIKDWYEKMCDEFEDKYEGIVFLCYEKPTDFCHRHILREIFNREYHIQIDEFPVKEKMEKKEPITNALF